MSEWYESFFDALAMDVWRAILLVEVSEAEADFLVRQLGGTPPGRRMYRPTGPPSSVSYAAASVWQLLHSVTPTLSRTPHVCRSGAQASPV